MKICTICGTKVNDSVAICPCCGGTIENPTQTPTFAAPAPTPNPQNPADAPNTGFAVLGFFIPIVGLILYLMNKDTAPLKAKSAGKGALIGAIVGVVSYILVIIFYIVIYAVIFSAGVLY